MENIDKAAVLLLGIGEKKAADVLKHLEPRCVQRVGIAMTCMANISKEEIKMVVSDFIQAAEKQTSLGVDSELFVKNMLIGALGENRAAALIDRILESTDEESGLAQLKWLDPRTVADTIRGEHPQVIATILTALDVEQAAEVVSNFPEEKRVDILYRMSSLDSVKPEALTELSKVIQEQLSGNRGGGKAASIGGIKSVADLINYLDANIEAQVMEGMMAINSDVCEQIKEQMFLFENINDMDSRSVQTFMKDVSTEVLLLALKGADDLVKEKIFSNMSKRAGELLRDDLEASGPVKVSEVEAAQKEILSVIRRLADEGELSLGSKGAEELI